MLMLRLGLAIAMLAASVTVVGAAHEEEDAAMARHFHLLGRWALDCSAPPSRSNPTEFYSIASDRSIRRRLTMNAPGLDGTTMIGMLQLIDDDEDNKMNAIWVRDSDDTITSTTLLFAGRRHRTWDSTGENLKPLIDDGIVVATGQPTPWFTKCDP